MPEVDAATSQATTTEGTEAELDALLGGEGNDGGSSAATEEVEAGEPQTETETEEAETGDESGEEGESTEADPGEESEEETETEEGAEDEGDEESELTFDENDRDYSDAAYEKAAKVYSKNLKVQFDPKDPKDRAVLREMMQRKEAFIKGLIEGAGWDREKAENHFLNLVPMFEIGNEIDFVLSEVRRLRAEYPKIMMAPLLYRIESNHLCFIPE